PGYGYVRRPWAPASSAAMGICATVPQHCNGVSEAPTSTASPRSDAPSPCLLSRRVPSWMPKKDVKEGGIGRSQFILDRPGRIQDTYSMDKKKLGEGTYGSVCRSTHKATRVVRAIKTIPKGKMRNVERFKKEIAIMKMMDHPNIIQEVSDHRNIYLAMELCTGGELFERIIKEGHFGEGDAATVMQQALRAVRYMHEHKIAHRDLKPENFLFQGEAPIRDNVLKLIDFGLACNFKDGRPMTTRAGTPYYVAPQVLSGKYCHQCDIWSCGASLSEDLAPSIWARSWIPDPYPSLPAEPTALAVGTCKTKRLKEPNPAVLHKPAGARRLVEAILPLHLHGAGVRNHSRLDAHQGAVLGFRLGRPGVRRLVGLHRGLPTPPRHDAQLLDLRLFARRLGVAPMSCAFSTSAVSSVYASSTLPSVCGTVGSSAVSDFLSSHGASAPALHELLLQQQSGLLDVLPLGAALGGRGRRQLRRLGLHGDGREHERVALALLLLGLRVADTATLSGATSDLLQVVLRLGGELRVHVARALGVKLVPDEVLRARRAGTSTLALLALVRRYVQNELTLPTLIHGEEEDSPQARQLLLEVRLLLRDYWPHPVLEFSGYASSAWMGLWVALLAHRQHPGRLEQLTLRDGGTVSLCWADPPEEAHHKRTAVLFPGLCNDSRTHFMGAAMRHLRAEGFQAVTFNYRGTGGAPLTSPRIGSFDSWVDVPEVLAHIEAQCPRHDLFAVGFSMGSAILLRHLGETGTSCRFRAAVAISAATDLPRVSASLKWPPRKLFLNAMMTTGLKLMTVVNGVHHSPHFRPFARSFFLATTLEGIDDCLTAPMNGYVNGKEFAALNSPHLTLHKVAVPTLILNARDDPVTSVSCLSLTEMRRNPHFYVVLTRRGGHIGWGTGGHGGSVSWTDRMAAHFLKSCESGRTMVDIAAEDDPHDPSTASRGAPGTAPSSAAPRSKL
ncbi:unnamed protein product, partial [Prorocentrum cordatum]